MYRGWKLKMQERSKDISRERPEDDEFRATQFLRSSDFPKSTDDDEIDNWFGHEKT
jgi:hypothetical protein